MIVKKSLSAICCAALVFTLAGCGKKDSLYEEGAPQSDLQTVTDTPESSSGSAESSSPLPDIPLQKISELRGELEKQVEAVKAAEYRNLHFTEDFAAKVPDADHVYDLTITVQEQDFQTVYEKFDRIFDREFGEKYTQEDKEKLYHVSIDGAQNDYLFEETLLVHHYDKLMNGEEKLHSLYIDTDEEYLSMPKHSGFNIWALNQCEIAEYVDPERDVHYYWSGAGTVFYDAVKSYLDFDSEDRYAILDAELSVKEAVEEAKKITPENGYAWETVFEPDVYQLKVLDLSNGKYCFQFTMVPSYKGVAFEAFESPDDSLYRGYGRYGAHVQKSYPTSADATMMEDGKFIQFLGGDGKVTVAENAEYDSVIPLENAVQMLSDAFGSGLNFSVSRAELIYFQHLVDELDNSVKNAFPVWKFRCHNSTDKLKYVVFMNAVSGEVEYYITDWWEI